MPYKATVYNIMLASPSDVDDERRVIRETIIKWNYSNSMSSGKVLIPLGWETHSAPLMGVRPQAVINEMVLQHADVLVGIFKDKLGSPTGQENSGTVEEIKKHHSLGRPVLLYFCNMATGDQSDAVQAYKEECKNKGLVCEYANCDVLRDKFSDHLQLVINGMGEKVIRRLSDESSLISAPGQSLSIVDGNIPVIDRKIKLLLAELTQDPRGELVISRYEGKELKVETNGGKFFGFENTVLQLEQSGWIRKTDSDNRIFILTDLGHQEITKSNQNDSAGHDAV